MIKTLSFACIHFCVAFTVIYLLTGDALVGGLMALIEPAINTCVYYCHERVWMRVVADPEKNTASGKATGLRHTPVYQN